MIDEYLDYLRKALSTPSEQFKSIRIYLGNQAADVDSVICSIVLGYSRCSEEVFHIPLINIPRTEMHLRRDVCYLLDLMHIDLHSLFYQDDLPHLIPLAEHCRLTLLDHNRLAPHQEGLADYVDEIIDHHLDEKINYTRLETSHKTIEKVASTATLVSEKLLQTSLTNIDVQSANLLLAAILIDTENLANGYITTPRDIAMANAMLAKSNIQEIDSFYEKLLSARRCTEGLQPHEILTKDFKIYRYHEKVYGIASISKGIEWTSANSSTWLPAFTSLLHSQQLSILCALVFNSANASTERDFIIFTPQIPLLQHLARHIDQNLSKHLQLFEQLPDKGLLFCHVTNGLSRKSLQPHLIKAEG